MTKNVRVVVVSLLFGTLGGWVGTGCGSEPATDCRVVESQADPPTKIIVCGSDNNVVTIGDSNSNDDAVPCMEAKDCLAENVQCDGNLSCEQGHCVCEGIPKYIVPDCTTCVNLAGDCIPITSDVACGHSGVECYPCAAGSRCVDGACRQPCEATTDCPSAPCNPGLCLLNYCHSSPYVSGEKCDDAGGYCDSFANCVTP
jgi:hypothetical protein